MKTKYSFIFLFVSFSLCSCNSQPKCDTTKCDEYGIKSAEFINEYFFSDEQNKPLLDSAQYYLDDVIKNCHDWKYYQNMVLRKLVILSLKRDYNQALFIIDTNKWDIDTISSSFFIPIVKKRFEAMQLLFNGDTISCNDTIKSIMLGLDKYLSPHEKEVKFVLTASEEESIKSPFCPAVMIYNHYKSLLCSKEEFEKEVAFMEQAGYNEMIIGVFKRPHEEDYNFLNYEGF